MSLSISITLTSAASFEIVIAIVVFFVELIEIVKRLAIINHNHKGSKTKNR